VQNTLAATDKNVPIICVTGTHFNYVALSFLSSACFINLRPQSILISLQYSTVQYDIIIKMFLENIFKIILFCDHDIVRISVMYEI
jgi:hypothetical protein